MTGRRSGHGNWNDDVFSLLKKKSDSSPMARGAERDAPRAMATSEHIMALIRRYPALGECCADVEAAFVLLRDVFRSGRTLWICGNGGSAADAEHIAGELLKGFARRRPLSGERARRLGDLASHLQGALPCVPLTGFLSLRTAWLNDCESDYVYAQLVHALGREGDVLLGISTSGHARNVLLALRAARALGLRTAGLTGRAGGAMAALCEVLIRAPAEETPLVQELHQPLYHTLCRMLEDEFFA